MSWQAPLVKFSSNQVIYHKILQKWFYDHDIFLNTCIIVVIPMCFLRLQPPSIPNASVFSEVVLDAFAMAIVGYAISISLGKTFALKHGYKVDSNQVGKSE